MLGLWLCTATSNLSDGGARLVCDWSARLGQRRSALALQQLRYGVCRSACLIRVCAYRNAFSIVKHAGELARGHATRNGSLAVALNEALNEALASDLGTHHCEHAWWLFEEI